MAVIFVLVHFLCFGLVLSDCCFNYDTDEKLLKCTHCDGDCRGERGYQTCETVTVGGVTGIVIGVCVFITIVLTLIVVIYYYIKDKKEKPPPVTSPERTDNLEFKYPKTKLPDPSFLSTNPSRSARGHKLQPIRNPPPPPSTGRSSRRGYLPSNEDY